MDINLWKKFAGELEKNYKSKKYDFAKIPKRAELIRLALQSFLKLRSNPKTAVKADLAWEKAEQLYKQYQLEVTAWIAFLQSVLSPIDIIWPAKDLNVDLTAKLNFEALESLSLHGRWTAFLNSLKNAYKKDKVKFASVFKLIQKITTSLKEYNKQKNPTTKAKHLKAAYNSYTLFMPEFSKYVLGKQGIVEKLNVVPKVEGDKFFAAVYSLTQTKVEYSWPKVLGVDTKAANAAVENKASSPSVEDPNNKKILAQLEKTEQTTVNEIKNKENAALAEVQEKVQEAKDELTKLQKETSDLAKKMSEQAKTPTEERAANKFTTGLEKLIKKAQEGLRPVKEAATEKITTTAEEGKENVANNTAEVDPNLNNLNKDVVKTHKESVAEIKKNTNKEIKEVVEETTKSLKNVAEVIKNVNELTTNVSKGIPFSPDDLKKSILTLKKVEKKDPRMSNNPRMSNIAEEGENVLGILTNYLQEARKNIEHEEEDWEEWYETRGKDKKYQDWYKALSKSEKSKYDKLTPENQYNYYEDKMENSREDW